MITLQKNQFYEATRGINPEAYRLPMREVLRKTSMVFGVPMYDLMSDRRTRWVARARQAAMGLMRIYSPASTTAIGGVLRRDHTTVLHGLRRFAEFYRGDPDFRKCVTRSYALIEQRAAPASIAPASSLPLTLTAPHALREMSQTTSLEHDSADGVRHMIRRGSAHYGRLLAAEREAPPLELAEELI